MSCDCSDFGLPNELTGGDVDKALKADKLTEIYQTKINRYEMSSNPYFEVYARR